MTQKKKENLVKEDGGPTDFDVEAVTGLATSGFYIALRIGFASPVEEINRLRPDWVNHYTKQRFMMFDPVVRWVHANTGIIKWSQLEADDPRQILKQAQTFGMRFGVAVSVFDDNPQGHRSFGYFARQDREFEAQEAEVLLDLVTKRHQAMAPPTNLTAAEIEALRLVKDGLRLKEVAHKLGVSEGAIKQRIKNAKAKLNANTSSQAATIAARHGIV